MPAKKTKRQRLLGSTFAGKLWRAVLLAAVIAAGTVVGNEVPALRPFIAILNTYLTSGGALMIPPQKMVIPEKATPPANEPAPNLPNQGEEYPAKKG